MQPSILRRAATLLAAAAALTCASAQAKTIEISYIVPSIGVALDFGSMGYTDELGNWVSLAGQEIVSSRVVVDFTPGRRVDPEQLYLDMVVPVEGAQSEMFAVTGADLAQLPSGTWHYDLTTDAFNGTIRDGRFSLESYGIGRFGNHKHLRGTLGETTGFYFTVEVAAAPIPEPGTVSLALAGLAAMGVVAKRRRRDDKA